MQAMNLVVWFCSFEPVASTKWLTGTDPGDAELVFRVASVTRQSGDMLVTWTMGTGGTNALQATVGDANGSARYYWVRLVP